MKQVFCLAALLIILITCSAAAFAANSSEQELIDELTEQASRSWPGLIAEENETDNAKNDSTNILLNEHKPFPLKNEKTRTADNAESQETGASFLLWIMVLLALSIGIGLVIYAWLMHEKKPAKSKTEKHF